MKHLLGLTASARLEVGHLLNLLLADETMLYITTRDYHWNVTGPCFPSLHQQFETQYVQIAEWIDQIAERARALDVGACGNWDELTNTARCSATPGIDLSAEAMVMALLALHETLIAQLRTDSDTCATRHHDAGTADLLTGLMEQHEKTAWMLRAQLEGAEPAASVHPIHKLQSLPS